MSVAILMSLAAALQLRELRAKATLTSKFHIRNWMVGMHILPPPSFTVVVSAAALILSCGARSQSSVPCSCSWPCLSCRGCPHPRTHLYLPS